MVQTFDLMGTKAVKVGILKIEMPSDARPLTIALVDERIVLQALVNTKAVRVKREIMLVFTGEHIVAKSIDDAQYAGAIHYADWGTKTLHIFVLKHAPTTN
jgi:hypothetical protein